MRMLVTGGKGMLGRTLQRRFADQELFVADLPEVDILERDALVAAFTSFRPDVVIHCAAMTKVDDCETNEEQAFRLNGMGSANVAFASRACGARLVAISTDYVFSGDVREWRLSPGGVRTADESGWRETDVTFPRTVYGKSKLAGERSILDILPEAVVLRIAWLYGAGGPSFVHTMAKLGAQEGAPLKVVNDQRGNPTSADVVADVIAFLLDHPEVRGVVHGTCEGVCTWYDLTVELFRLMGLARGVEPCTTEEFPRPAPRPANSALEKTVLHALGYRPAHWRDALADFVAREFGI
ncbi:MAG: dTDP-4-dehydrorhamnose reductase [Kiritimatiellia bacterium]